MERPVDLVVAGHICLDVIPAFRSDESRSLHEIIRPGTLVHVGGAAVSTGGAVSNTGLAAIRLGLETRLMGKIGDDFFGRGILEVLRGRGADDGMLIVPGEESSYTIVIAAPGADRMFLHNPGANDTFAADDVRLDVVRSARLFHFGYPPLMRRFFEDEGRELETLMRSARGTGATTSLDMSLPDPHAPAGRAPWPAILERALPHVDLFAPSAEELLLMLDRVAYLKRASAGDVLEQLTTERIAAMAERCLAMGAAVVLVKCGTRGLYLRTADARRMTNTGAAAPADIDPWTDREAWELPYRVDRFAGATGSGDCCIAGFLAALLRGCGVEEALHYAAAAGAQNVTALDAISGIRPWDETTRRIHDGWPKCGDPPAGAGWRQPHPDGCLLGPRDRTGLRPPGLDMTM